VLYPSELRRHPNETSDFRTARTLAGDLSGDSGNGSSLGDFDVCDCRALEVGNHEAVVSRGLIAKKLDTEIGGLSNLETTNRKRTRRRWFTRPTGY